MQRKLIKTGIIFLIISTIFIVYPAGSRANSIEMIEVFFQEDLGDEYFTEQVLQQLTVEELTDIREEYTAGLGEFNEVKVADQDNHIYNVYFSKGIIEMQMVVNENNEIAGLYFISVTETSGDFLKVVSDFEELKGEVSLLLTRNGEELAAINPDEKMAVGSTFKIAVLAELNRSINAGERNWSDVVQLNDSQKSLASGQLQNWPDGTYLTLNTLANLMISISDNTATDILIEELGRDNIEEYNDIEGPFLKTREAFKLKDPDNEELLERYRKAEIEDKYELLIEVDEQDLPSGTIFDRVRATDIEWHFTAYEIAELMTEVKELELMSINPGVASKSNWERIAYKGGSEPGVFNLSTWLEAEDGTEYFLTATWNSDDFLDEDKFTQLYKNLIGNLR
ncbi:MAG: serine hydrolase [Halanaerobiaceae bacterium]